MENTRVIYASLPSTIGGYTIAHDDFYTIVLNQNMNHEKNIESYAHEINHIKNGDFEKKSDADLIEFYAHKVI